jgi:hypothetical protein
VEDEMSERAGALLFGRMRRLKHESCLNGEKEAGLCAVSMIRLSRGGFEGTVVAYGVEKLGGCGQLELLLGCMGREAYGMSGEEDEFVREDGSPDNRGELYTG